MKGRVDRKDGGGKRDGKVRVCKKKRGRMEMQKEKIKSWRRSEDATTRKHHRLQRLDEFKRENIKKRSKHGERRRGKQ